jgi:hypothetical protein
MIQRITHWVRSFNDPLRNANHAARWIAHLHGTDPLAIQREALELVSGFPGARTEVGPAQVEALLRIDARLEPVVAQLTQQYTINYQKSSAVESRLWHAVFDLVKAFAVAYNIALKAGYPRADNKRWRAILPWVLVRLAHYKGGNSTSWPSSRGCAAGSASSWCSASARFPSRVSRSSRNT